MTQYIETKCSACQYKRWSVCIVLREDSISKWTQGERDRNVSSVRKCHLLADKFLSCVTWCTMATYRTLFSCLVAVIKWHTSMCDVCKHGHICVMEVGLNKGSETGLTFKYSSSLCHITSIPPKQNKCDMCPAGC